MERKWLFTLRMARINFASIKTDVIENRQGVQLFLTIRFYFGGSGRRGQR